METENPFGDTSSEHAEVLRLIANFWKFIPILVSDMLQQDDRPMKLSFIAKELHEQVKELMSWFSPTDDRPVQVSDYYRILFFMRDRTQPIVCALQQVADEMNIDLKVPYIQENGEIVVIELDQWIPERLLNR